MFNATGEFRTPKVGEWYVAQGAIPIAIQRQPGRGVKIKALVGSKRAILEKSVTYTISGITQEQLDYIGLQDVSLEGLYERAVKDAD